MRLLQLHHCGHTWTETCTSDCNTLRITLHITMLSFFKGFGLFSFCSVLFPTSQPFTTMLQLCQGVKSSCFHLFEKLGTPWPAALNCSTPPSSPNLCLSPSLQTTPVSLLPSRTSSIDLPSVFSLPSSHRHSSFSSINPIASISSTSALSSSTPTNSSSSTVHL